MEDFNLHLTGDIHAITAAHNLIAAAIDARMLHEADVDPQTMFDRLCPKDKKGQRTFAPTMLRRLQEAGHRQDRPGRTDAGGARALCVLDIDPASITWNRVIDISDRFLRKIEIGLGPDEKGHTRITGYDISVASEIMAILALTTGLEDLRERIGRVRDRHQQGGRGGDGGRPGRGGRGDRPDEGRHHAQPDADGGGAAGVRACRAVRQHCARQLLDHRRPDRAQAGRLRGDGIGLRRRHGHGEVHGHQVPLLGAGARTAWCWWRRCGR